jgi:hypothetical protein
MIKVDGSMACLQTTSYQDLHLCMNYLPGSDVQSEDVELLKQNFR